MEILAENGRVYPIDDFTEDERDDMELPGLEAEPGFVKKIAEA
jgi:hypothetical protein